MTRTAVSKLLGRVPDYPGSSPSPTAPSRLPRHLDSRPDTPNLVYRTEFATAPGSPAAVLAFYRREFGRGFRVSGSSIYGATLETRWSVLGRPSRSRAYEGLSVQVTAQQIGSRVGVRVDAEAIWLTRRPKAAFVPTTTKTVRVVVERTPTARTVRRVLGADWAGRLARIARIVDELTTVSPAVVDRPYIPARRYLDVLVFGTASGPVRVDVAPDGCRNVGIYRHGRPVRSLLEDNGRRSLDAAALRALGLPADYGLSSRPASLTGRSVSPER